MEPTNPAPDEPDPVAAAIEVFPDAVLRCAALPAHALDPFHAPALAAAARLVGAVRNRIIARRPRLDALLHAAVPATADRRARHLLLGVKRQIHRDTEPIGNLDEVLRSVDRELAEALLGEQRSRLRLAELRAAFAAEHAAALRRHRLLLRCIGAGERFRKALLLASPDLSASWEAELRTEAATGRTTTRSTVRTEGVTTRSSVRTGSASTRSAVRTERMERGVFAYLVRAATRPTPHGLWAGVVPVAMDESGRSGRLVLHPAEPRYAVAPDLTVFRTILDALTREPRYRGKAPVRLPPAETDPWAALAKVGDDLLHDDRERWTATVMRLRASCRDLAERLERTGVDELRRCLTAIGEEIRAFAGRAGIEDGVPRWPIRVDYRPGLAATWDPTFRETVRRAVAETLAYYEEDQGPELLRRSSMRLLLGDETEIPLDHIVRNAGAAYRVMTGMGRPTGAAARIHSDLRIHRDAPARRWRDRLRTSPLSYIPYRIPAEELPSDPIAGPGGAVVLAVAGSGALRVEWGRPQPLALSARFEPLLSEPDASSPLAVAVRNWYASWPPRTAQAMEVAAADPPSLNVATRPTVTERRLISTDDTTKTVVRTESLRPWLEDPGRGDALVPVCNSAAGVGGWDLRGFVLHRLALGHGWEFICRRLLPRPAPGTRIPRIELPSSAALSPARWTLGERDLNEILDLDEADRYLAWRARAEDLGLPDAVWTVIEDDPEAAPLFFMTTGPFAVAAMLHRLEEQPRPVEFFEAHGAAQPWIECPDTGHRYACELAVTWHDTRYWKKVRKP
ncbi:lantibiotic dehydratase [Actinomadura rupiterrae]|uniref:lantibiotic dehydratase n=1 Tax=Actinomadura rupiterrae TaxID=559627 RepID=UPI0020A3E061|nr:lantibiotic dehydratase [Actinomadura rupiterrae]MCP2336564.1 hypothetical protein [Actinomadura rupiterrae]